MSLAELKPIWISFCLPWQKPSAVDFGQLSAVASQPDPNSESVAPEWKVRVLFFFWEICIFYYGLDLQKKV